MKILGSGENRLGNFFLSSVENFRFGQKFYVWVKF